MSCQQKQSTVQTVALPVPTRKGEVWDVKAEGSQGSITVGVVYPLESSPEEVASTIDLTIQSANKKNGKSCQSTLIYASDPSLVEYVAARLKVNGVVTIHPTTRDAEDPKALEYAAEMALRDHIEVAFVVKGELVDRHLDHTHQENSYKDVVRGDHEDVTRKHDKDEDEPPPAGAGILSPKPPAIPPLAGVAHALLPRLVTSVDAKVYVGGVDFTDLKLASVGFVHVENKPTLEWVVEAVKGKSNDTESAERIWKTFLACLNLSDTLFWVNLNPSEPNRIIDPLLAVTDIGRVMLEADLQLKYDVGEIIDPRKSRTGKEYWRRLAKIAGWSNDNQSKLTAETRVWIVPETVKVECSGAKAFIIDAALNVLLESEKFGTSKHSKFFGKTSENDEAGELAKELILPELRRRVNFEPQHAMLRQAYRSLVLARWCKSQIPAISMPFVSTINTNDLEPILRTSLRWSHLTIYNQYLESLNKGVFNFSQTEGVGTSFYFYGGVDWTQIQFSDSPQPESLKTNFHSHSHQHFHSDHDSTSDNDTNATNNLEQRIRLITGKVSLEK